jgi:hypothetical protein
MENDMNKVLLTIIAMFALAVPATADWQEDFDAWKAAGAPVKQAAAWRSLIRGAPTMVQAEQVYVATQSWDEFIRPRVTAAALYAARVALDAGKLQPGEKLLENAIKVWKEAYIEHGITVSTNRKRFEDGAAKGAGAARLLFVYETRDLRTAADYDQAFVNLVAKVPSEQRPQYNLAASWGRYMTDPASRYQVYATICESAADRADDLVSKEVIDHLYGLVVESEDVTAAQVNAVFEQVRRASFGRAQRLLREGKTDESAALMDAVNYVATLQTELQ